MRSKAYKLDKDFMPNTPDRWEIWLSHRRFSQILPMGYNPALETKYINACETDACCASIDYLNMCKEKGWPTNDVEIKSYDYLYRYYPRPEREGRKPLLIYRICTGCKHPLRLADAIRLNSLLGHKEPVKELKKIDLEGFDDFW